MTDRCEETGNECVSILLDELMAGNTDCEGCDTVVCVNCGQDVDVEGDE